MKKIISILCCLSLLCVCFGASAATFNAEGMPVMDEMTTFDIMCVFSALCVPYNEMPLFQELEKETNVHIEWEEVSSNYQERKNLAFAGGESKLPDAFFGKGCISDADVIRYSAQGLLQPMDDLIEKYCPNLQAMLAARPSMRSFLSAPDGHIYTLPCIEEQTYLEAGSHLFINKTWLEKVNMEMPTTTEEFYQVLKAFKEAGDLNGNGKDDEIPFSFRFSDWCDGIMCMFGAFGIPDDLRSTAKHMAISEDGQKVIYVPMLDSYREGVEWFAKMYAEGLIDVEAFTQDNSQYVAKGMGDDLVYGAFMKWADFQVVGWDKAYNDYTYLLPLKGPEGDQYWTYNDQMWMRNTFAITSACENPEALMRWVDQMFDPIKSVEWIYGTDGKCIAITEESIKWLDAPEGMNQQDWRCKQTPSNGPACVLKEMTALMDRSAEPGVVRRTERTNAYREFLYMNYYPQVYLTEEQSMIADMYATDLYSYTDGMTAEWIVKGGIADDWDAYMKELYNRGLQDLIDVYQAAYDTYLSNQ